ncbi:MAG: tetratricopeptide repeat protein [Bacteroidota bacterium]
MQRHTPHPDAQDLNSGRKTAGLKSFAQKFSSALHAFKEASYQAPSSHTAYYKLAKVSVSQGDFEAAIIHFSEAIKLKPNGTDLYMERAMAYEKVEMYDEAFEDLTNCLKIEKKNAQVYVQRARLHLLLGNELHAKADLEQTVQYVDSSDDELLAEAQELLNKMLGEEDPAIQNRIDHLMEGALASFNKQVYPAAIALYTEVLDLNPRHSLAVANRAQAYIRMYDYRSALIDIEQSIELDNTSASLRMSKGYILLRMGERKKALVEIEKAIEMDAELAEAYAYRAECKADNDRDAAFKDLNYSLQMLPDFWEAFQFRGLLHLDDESWMEAARDFCSTLDLNSRAYQAHEGIEQIDEHYRWAISRNPEDPQAYIRRAHFLNMIGRPEEALGHWDRALNLDPKNCLLLHGRAMIRRELEQLPYALIDINKVIEMVDDEPDYYRDRAIILAELFRPKEALADLDKAISLDPDKAELYLVKGRLLRMKANYEESVFILKMARSLGREDEELHKEMALCYLALKEVDKAAEHYKLAIEDEIYPELTYDYATVLMWLGKVEEAVPYLDYTLEHEPDHWEALLERAEALSQIQSFDEAFADLEKAGELKPNHAEIWLKRAEVYAKMENWHLVEKACERALEQDYRLTAAKELLAQAKTNFKQN